jgi:hypothetical protein
MAVLALFASEENYHVHRGKAIYLAPSKFLVMQKVRVVSCYASNLHYTLVESHALKNCVRVLSCVLRVVSRMGAQICGDQHRTQAG